MGDIVSKFMGIKTEEIESFRRENGTFNPESDITKWELTKYINL